MIKNIKARLGLITAVVVFFAWFAGKGVGGDLELGVDLKGGSELIFKFDLKETDARAEIVKTALGVIQQRVDAYGLKDVAIQPIGDDRFAVQVSAKDAEKVDAVKDLVTDLGRLEFHITLEPTESPNYEYYWSLFQDDLKRKNVDTTDARTITVEELKAEDRGKYPYGLRWHELSDRAKSEGHWRNPENKRTPWENGEWQPWVLLRLDDYDVTGEALENVMHLPGQGVGEGWKVTFEVDKLKQGDMADLTETEQTHMAIVLNGQIDSAPVLKSSLSASGEISGNFTESEARSLAAVLQSGALKEKPTLIAERTIAPDLAGDARNRGVLSTLIGFAIVLVMMVWMYKASGLLANLALLLNLVLLVGVLTWFGATLTLPGIAGVVLTVGMAVDANILVFERIKEEKAKGRTTAQAVRTGYDRALVTIIDANLTTLITAYFLFQIGSGPVRGFGITLAVGIVASMFTALYVTRTVFALCLKKGWITEARMRGDFQPPKIEWTAMMRKAVTGSAIAMAIGVVLWESVDDNTKYDLDFTEGSKLIVRFADEQQLDDVRETMRKLAQKNTEYKDVTARVSAEGIGATVADDAGRGFELRSQNISTEEEIEQLKEDLRTEFKGRLLPGPFAATIREGGQGRTVGEVYFLDDKVTETAVRQALLRYAAETGRLTDPEIAPLEKAPPGTERAFRLRFANSPERAGQIALNVRNAFSQFDKKEAIEALKKIEEDTGRKPSEQRAARADREALEKIEGSIGPTWFTMADPFPLADRIDPTTAEEHRDAAIKAIALSIIGIILYVAFRFRSWSFGFAAVIALIHDVLIVLGIVAGANWLGLVDARLNLVTVAAFLTLIGYSINDSIVVFDRIRENRGVGKSRLRSIINRSVNQTFSRTIRTTGTTWIVVAILFFMNLNAGSSLEGFAFILMLGVLIGTYSSVFIASPTLLYVPWLWEECGEARKGFLKRCIPWCVAGAVALFAIDGLRGNLSKPDPSVTVFNDILLAIPAGILAMFLWNFVRFVHAKDEMAEKTTPQAA